jgi:hypothetical protein
MALADSGKYSTFSLHRLVAEAFIGPRPAGMEVNHKDGNKGNNQADNLEYVTKSENVRHAMRLGLVNPTAKLPQDTKGEANGRAILTAADVVDIRNKWRAGIDSKTIASQYGLADKYVWRVASGQTWKHVA